MSAEEADRIPAFSRGFGIITTPRQKYTCPSVEESKK